MHALSHAPDGGSLEGTKGSARGEEAAGAGGGGGSEQTMKLRRVSRSSSIAASSHAFVFAAFCSACARIPSARAISLACEVGGGVQRGGGQHAACDGHRTTRCRPAVRGDAHIYIDISI